MRQQTDFGLFGDPLRELHRLDQFDGAGRKGCRVGNAFAALVPVPAKVGHRRNIAEGLRWVQDAGRPSSNRRGLRIGFLAFGRGSHLPRCDESLEDGVRVCRHCLHVVDRDGWRHDAGRLGADGRSGGQELQDPPTEPIPIDGSGFVSVIRMRPWRTVRRTACSG